MKLLCIGFSYFFYLNCFFLRFSSSTVFEKLASRMILLQVFVEANIHLSFFLAASPQWMNVKFRNTASPRVADRNYEAHLDLRSILNNKRAVLQFNLGAFLFCYKKQKIPPPWLQFWSSVVQLIFGKFMSKQKPFNLGAFGFCYEKTPKGPRFFHIGNISRPRTKNKMPATGIEILLEVSCWDSVSKVHDVAPG